MEKLRLHGADLVSHIELSSLFWEILYQEKVIEDIEEFTMRGTRADQVSHLLQYMRRGCYNVHYRGLILALIHTNQVVIVTGILGETVADFTTPNSPDNGGADGRQRLAELLARSCKRRSRIKRCPWDHHKLLEVDEVFQPLVLEMREMTNMGVEKTYRSMTALFSSTESLTVESDEADLQLHNLLLDGSRICINGARGSGKSTLLTKIEKDSTHGKGLAEDSDLVFHIDCEMLRLDEDIISYVRRCNLPHLKPREEQALHQHLGQASDGVNLLFLIDNVDHIKLTSGELNNTDIKNLLSGKSFHYSRVIVTSRSPNWNYQTPSDIIFDKHISIKGFSVESLHHYIAMFYEDSVTEADGMSYDQLIKLTDDPQVFSLLRFPLHINFFMFAARDKQIHGRTELYTHVLRAILSQSQSQIQDLGKASKMLSQSQSQIRDRDKARNMLSQSQSQVQDLNKTSKMLYTKRQLQMPLLSQLGFVTAAGEVAYMTLTGEEFDLDDDNFSEDHQTAINLGLLTVTTTDRDQTYTETITVQHQELTEYLATVYLASLAKSPNLQKTGRRGSITQKLLSKATQELTDKVQHLWNMTKNTPDSSGILEILIFSASISIEVFQVIIKCCVSEMKDDCYQELQVTREWHVTIRNETIQAMRRVMDAFLVAYSEVPPAWKDRAGHVFRILTKKCLVMFAMKQNLQLAVSMLEGLNVKFFSHIKAVLLVYKNGHAFSTLLTLLLSKAHNIKYLHILLYLDLPNSIPKDFSGFQSVTLPAGERVHLDLVLHGGQKVIDLYGIPLHNLSTLTLRNVHHLQSLCLRDARLTVDDSAALAEVIKGQSKLEVLNLHNNPHLAQGLRPVIGVLQYTPRLQTLDLSRTGLTPEAWSDLQLTFPLLKHLTFLELSMNPGLGDAALNHPPEFVKIKHLQEVHLRDCDLTIASLNLCLTSLLSNHSLRVLDLLDNHLDLDDPSCDLVTFINDSCKLQYLFIHGNHFTRVWLSDVMAGRKIKVDAESDPDREMWETRFVSKVCVAKSIQSAPSYHSLGLYLPPDDEEEDIGYNSS